MSKLVNAICEIYQVSRHKTASYNPQANGCVERQNATISKTIAKYVQKDQQNWHKVLPVVLMGMRSQPNTETSGFSPYKMLFGGEMRLPFDVNLIPKDSLKPEDKIIVRDLLDTLKLVHGTAKSNTETTQNESKEKHDVKAKESNYMLMELVLKKLHKHTPGLSGKLEEKWDGPYYIVAKGPSDTYKLANCKTNKVSKSFDTARNLKRYYNPDVYRHSLVHTEDDSNEDTPDADGDNNEEMTTDNQVTETPEEDSEQEQSQTVHKDVTADESQKQTRTNTIPNSPQQEKLTTTQRRWFPVNKILKQRFRDGKRQYLLEWKNSKYKPSWQDEEDVSPELKRVFHITHTKAGKRRKRQPYRYFKKSND